MTRALADNDNRPRLMNRADAAAYCGVGTSTFHAWVRNGFLPQPLFGSKRWDRKALDVALDKASGIANDNAADEEDPFERWIRTGR